MTAETDRFERLARIRALVEAEPDMSDGPGASGNGRSAQPDVLQRLCRAAARSFPAWGVGLSVMTVGGIHGTVAASDSVSALVEDLQFTVGEGPCLDAVASGRPVLNADLGAATSRWPAYAPAAYDYGVRAVYAFPMQIGAMRLGALDVYSDRLGLPSRSMLQDALAFAEVALSTLLDAQAEAPAGQTARVLDDGLNARAELFQAQGMLTVQLGIGLAEATVRLRAYAYANDRPLLDVARDIVGRRLTLDADSIDDDA